MPMVDYRSDELVEKGQELMTKYKLTDPPTMCLSKNIKLTMVRPGWGIDERGEVWSRVEFKYHEEGVTYGCDICGKQLVNGQMVWMCDQGDIDCVCDDCVVGI